MKKGKQNKLCQKDFFYGPSAILTPLCDSKMAKVPIVQWSQNLNFLPFISLKTDDTPQKFKQ